MSSQSTHGFKYSVVKATYLPSPKWEVRNGRKIESAHETAGEAHAAVQRYLQEDAAAKGGAA